MKKALILMLLLLALTLSGCSEDPVAETPPAPEVQTPEKTPHEHITAEGVVVPEERTPVYVTLPAGEDSADLVFYRPAEDGQAVYEDVSGLPNALAVPSVCGNLGDTVTTQVRLCGQSGLCAYDLQITYDKNRLKFAGTENEDDDLIVHCDEESGVIRMNFLRVANLKKSFVFCDLLFEVITAEICDVPLDVQVVEAVALDDSGEIVFCDYTVVDGMAWLNQKEVDD